ncbi:hypothetical protein FOL47_002102, partial [Perkinsus chesapeaki]
LQTELSNGLDFPAKVLLNTLCQRVLGPAGDSQGSKAADIDLGDLLVQAGRRFGSLPDPGLLCSNSATLKKMKDVRTALTIDLTECHPRSDLSHGVDIDTGNFSNCTQLLPSIFLAVDKDSRRKITSFSDFSASFLRYAVTLVVHFPIQESDAGASDRPQVGLLDLLAYWKRLYDVAVPLTVNGVVAFDKEYRSQLALKVVQHSVTLSAGFAQDCVPGLLASYLARFSQAAQPRAGNSSRSGGQSRNKSSEVCRHFLRGTCHYGRSCRFSHSSPGSASGASSSAGRQGQGPYSRQESSDGRGASGSGAVRPKGPLVSSCEEVTSDPLFQDGSGLPVQLDELYSRTTKPSEEAVKFLSLLSDIVDEYKLPEVLQSNLSSEGGLTCDGLNDVRIVFENAANELRQSLTQLFAIDDRVALVSVALVVLLLIGLLVAWEKLRVSASSVKYVGFVVSLDASPVTISVPEAKLCDTLRLISSVIASPSHVSINALEKVAGRLVWLCRVCEFARPYLSPLYERLGIAPLFKALKWWENTLRVDGAPYGEFRLSMPVFPPGVLSPKIYIASDASTSGLGAWAKSGERTCWFNLSLTDGRALGKWRRFLENPSKPSSSDMVFLETLAAALGLVMALKEFEPDSAYRSWISLRSDNAATVASFKKLRSSTPRINEVLRSLACRLAKMSYRFDVCYISSEENYYADVISRERSPSKYLPADWERVVVLPSALKCNSFMPPTLTRRGAASIGKQSLSNL